jgi:hypothetical protein
MTVDTVPVGIVGAEGRNTLEVAAVSRSDKGIDTIDALSNVRKEQEDVNLFVVIAVVFLLSIVCAIFIGAAG